MTEELSQDQILQEIEKHRRAIAELEAKLEPKKTWPPTGFYGTFYVVAGLILGVLGGLTSFLFNIIGSMIVAQDPMKILRVFGTFFIGEEALTTANLNFLMLVLLVHFTVAAVGGALFHVGVNRYFAGASLGRKILLSGVFGILLWIINFYAIISWLQPLLVGQAYILQMMPFWVAILTHLIYGLTLGILQPLGMFVAYRPATS